MNKLDYSNFDSTNADIAFSETNGYSNPTSELLTRKQFSYPLKEIKTFLGNAIPVDSNGNVVQLEVNDDNSLSYRSTPGGALTDLTGGIPSGGTTGQVLVKKSNSNYDTEWSGSSAFSFVGMVVQGTSLSTEASVKAIYGETTSWTLLSSVILGSEHIFGNGKTLGLINGTLNLGLTIATGSGNKVVGTHTDSYGKDIGSSYSGNFNTSTSGIGTGVLRKTDLDSGTYGNTGLVADTKTVYSWERTL